MSPLPAGIGIAQLNRAALLLGDKKWLVERRKEVDL